MAEDFIVALKIMGQGMAGIFIIILLLMLFIYFIKIVDKFLNR